MTKRSISVYKGLFIMGVFLHVLPCRIHAQDLDQSLFILPDLAFEQIETPDGYEAAYELRILQPVDHGDNQSGFFLQRAFLSHKGFDRPTVFITEGYAGARNRISELARVLDANQVRVEHRYFGVSVPEPLEWEHLNLEQATADLHHVRTLLGQLYDGKWLSSGISKGGQTTIFYRYYYPDDVDVSVPYVAPLNFAFADPRIFSFLDTAGTAECRAFHLSFQKTLLQERDEVLTRLNWFSKGQGMTFEYMGLEAAFEYAILEYPFSFWQSGFDCASVPVIDESLDVLVDHFNDVVGLFLYSDRGVNQFGPHYYQAASEMGYYGFETANFTGLLKALPQEPHAAFVPKGVEVDYDPTLSRQVGDWLDADGNNFIYIYGAVDTWSATGVEVSPATNAVKFVLPGAHHGTARIMNMTPENRKRMRTILEDWLEMTLDPDRWE